VARRMDVSTVGPPCRNVRAAKDTPATRPIGERFAKAVFLGIDVAIFLPVRPIGGLGTLLEVENADDERPGVRNGRGF
jgi:hypothetical protein